MNPLSFLQMLMSTQGVSLAGMADQALPLAMGMFMPGGEALGGMFAQPVSKWIQGDGYGTDVFNMPLWGAGSAFGSYMQMRNNQMRSAASPYLKQIQFASAQKFGSQINRIGQSYENWAKEMREQYGYGDDYITRANYNADMDRAGTGLANNPIFGLAAKAIDPYGANAALPYIQKAMQNIGGREAMLGDYSRYNRAGNMAREIFTNYNSADWGGATMEGTAAVMAKLSKNVDAITASASGGGAKIKKFKDTLKEYTEALAPLTEVFGNDMPKLMNAMERMTGKSLSATSPEYVKKISNELANASLIGGFTAEQTAGLAGAVTANLRQMPGVSTTARMMGDRVASSIQYAAAGGSPYGMSQQDFQQIMAKQKTSNMASNMTDTLNNAFALYLDKVNGGNPLSAAEVQKYEEQFKREMLNSDGSLNQAALKRVTGTDNTEVINMRGRSSANFRGAWEANVGLSISESGSLNNARMQARRLIGLAEGSGAKFSEAAKNGFDNLIDSGKFAEYSKITSGVDFIEKYKQEHGGATNEEALQVFRQFEAVRNNDDTTYATLVSDSLARKNKAQGKRLDEMRDTVNGILKLKPTGMEAVLDFIETGNISATMGRLEQGVVKSTEALIKSNPELRAKFRNIASVATKYIAEDRRGAFAQRMMALAASPDAGSNGFIDAAMDKIAAGDASSGDYAELVDIATTAGLSEETLNSLFTKDGKGNELRGDVKDRIKLMKEAVDRGDKGAVTDAIKSMTFKNMAEGLNEEDKKAYKAYTKWAEENKKVVGAESLEEYRDKQSAGSDSWKDANRLRKNLGMETEKSNQPGAFNLAEAAKSLQPLFDSIGKKLVESIERALNDWLSKNANDVVKSPESAAATGK